MVTKQQARAAKAKLLPLAEKYGASIGLGGGSGGDFIVQILLSKEVPVGTFPEEQDGVKVVVEVSGEVTAYDHHHHP